MEFDKELESMIAYCVPVEGDHEENQSYAYQDYIYPSASATYSYTYPIIDDQDFCDIITDLAQGEYFDYTMGPSAVALPVHATDGEAVAALTIAVPDICVSSYDGKDYSMAPAKVVDAMVFHDESTVLAEKCVEWEQNVEEADQDILKKNKTYEKKIRRMKAVRRLKEKRLIKSAKLALKSAEAKLPGLPGIKLHETKKERHSSTVFTARQIAAASRERVKGKFKHNKTRWISVTEFNRQTKLGADALNT